MKRILELIVEHDNPQLNPLAMHLRVISIEFMTLRFAPGTNTAVILLHLQRLQLQPCSEEQVARLATSDDALLVALGSPSLKSKFETAEQLADANLHDIEFQVFLGGKKQMNHHWGTWSGAYEFVVTREPSF